MNNNHEEEYKLRLDLGCGTNKKPGFKGVDIISIPGVDYVVNLEDGLHFLKDNSVDEFYSSHFLEHIDNFEYILSEIFRTLKPEGTCIVIVPHFSNPYYYSDYSHKRFFGLYSFDYFTVLDTGYKRKVTPYNRSIQFQILYRKLIFRSPNCFVINLFKKYVFGILFNSSKFFQELYEEFFSRLFYCYEIKFIIKKP